MNKLFKEGKNFSQIAKEVGLVKSTVIYHLVPETREKDLKRQVEYFRNLPPKKKREIYLSRKDYVNEWLKKKYKEDKEFREKKLKYSREYYKRTKGSKK